MKTVKRSRKMDASQGMEEQELREVLHREIDSIKSILEVVSSDGSRLLDTSEKNLIRHIISGTWLDMMTDEFKLFFKQGHSQDACISMDRIITVLHQFS